jgi:hypothetical protein
MNDCDHISKVIEWGFDEKHNSIPTLYGCSRCEATQPKPFITEDIFSDHAKHTDYNDSCFACKVRTLELNTGDAGRADSLPQKKWDAELSAYRSARAEGIQPSGTTMKKINEAKEASEKMGVAYNAEAMPAARKITKRHATVMKETGAI